MLITLVVVDRTHRMAGCIPSLDGKPHMGPDTDRHSNGDGPPCMGATNGPRAGGKPHSRVVVPQRHAGIGWSFGVGNLADVQRRND